MAPSRGRNQVLQSNTTVLEYISNLELPRSMDLSPNASLQQHEQRPLRRSARIAQKRAIESSAARPQGIQKNTKRKPSQAKRRQISYGEDKPAPSKTTRLPRARNHRRHPYPTPSANSSVDERERYSLAVCLQPSRSYLPNRPLYPPPLILVEPNIPPPSASTFELETARLWAVATLQDLNGNVVEDQEAFMSGTLFDSPHPLYQEPPVLPSSYSPSPSLSLLINSKDPHYVSFPDIKIAAEGTYTLGISLMEMDLSFAASGSVGARSVCQVSTAPFTVSNTAELGGQSLIGRREQELVAELERMGVKFPANLAEEVIDAGLESPVE
jgi:hypothetical protein